MDIRMPRTACPPTIPGFTGRVVTPADDDYTEVRALWNGQVDRRPRLIAVCATESDAAAAVRFARDAALPLAVRGGGHNVAGHALCDDGLVIDLSELRGVALDAPGRRVAVQGGARLGDLDTATVPHGRLVPSGIVTDTGVGGLTLGGGLGWTARRHGLTCDHLDAVDLVTADGEQRHVDEDTDAELLWGLRGGGGNFGIVTRFHFRTVRFDPRVVAGFVVYPLAEDLVGEALAVLAHLGEGCDDLTAITFLRMAPPLPWMPAEVVGTPVLMIGLVHLGEPAAALEHLAPLRRLATPAVDTVAPRPFLEHQRVIDAANPTGRRYYWSSRYLDRSGDDPAGPAGLAGTVTGHTRSLSSPTSLIALFQLGGAIRHGAATSCAPHRTASHLLTYGSQWAEEAEDERHRAWTRRCLREVAGFGTGGGYTNFDGDRAATAERAFPPEAMRRLAVLKHRLDPENAFRHNVNISPARPTGE